jgi:BirA family transcriptional regulator, biotin operon repressor / biotin---[acetyl-CoA-carboxylase] ligase
MLFDKCEIIRLSSIGSTNQYLSEILNTNTLAQGSIVTAYDQTQGKGQDNNGWESEPGKNLTVSIVLYPVFLKPELQFQLTMVVSLSVCETLDNYPLPERAQIKWPNDIYIGNRKIAGILIKNEIMGNSISCTIAGLGLNINQAGFTDNAPGAVSLRMLTNKEYDIDKILTDWHNNLAHWYERLMNKEFRKINDAYLDRFYLLNQQYEFIIRGERIEATIRGLAEYGMLLMEGTDGKQYICSLKEVVFPKNL